MQPWECKKAPPQLGGLGSAAGQNPTAAACLLFLLRRNHNSDLRDWLRLLRRGKQEPPSEPGGSDGEGAAVRVAFEHSPAGQARRGAAV